MDREVHFSQKNNLQRRKTSALLTRERAPYSYGAAAAATAGALHGRAKTKIFVSFIKSERNSIPKDLGLF